MTKHVDAGIAAGSIEHPLGFGQRVSQRLFAEDDLLGLSGGNRNRHMQIAGRADVDDVNIFSFYDLLPGGRVFQPTVFVGRAFDRRFVPSANHFHYRVDREIEEATYLPPGIAVSLAHEAVTNHRDIQFPLHSPRRYLLQPLKSRCRLRNGFSRIPTRASGGS